MKKILLFSVFILLFMAIPVRADNIPCEAGKCDGWEITYEKVDNYFNIVFYNNTGKTAFDLTVKILVYLSDGSVRAVSQKLNMPIRKQVPLRIAIPPRFLKMGAEIYYREEY